MTIFPDAVLLMPKAFTGGTDGLMMASGCFTIRMSFRGEYIIPGQLVALEMFTGIPKGFVTLLGGGGGGGTWMSSSSMAKATLLGRTGVRGLRWSPHTHSLLMGFDGEEPGSCISGMLVLLNDFRARFLIMHSGKGDLCPLGI
jgi:hypothetical protein